MRRTSLACLAIVAVLSVGNAPNDMSIPESRVAELDGTWERQWTWVVTECTDGEYRDICHAGAGEEWSIDASGMRGYWVGKVTIYPTGGIKGMDIDGVRGYDRKPFKRKAIYKVKGDRLILCVAPDGQPRPTDFNYKAHRETQLVIFERHKP